MSRGGTESGASPFTPATSMQSLDDEDTSDHEPDAWNGWIKLQWKRLSDLLIFQSSDFWMRRSRKVSGCVTGTGPGHTIFKIEKPQKTGYTGLVMAGL
jgi:hypothetical protein